MVGLIAAAVLLGPSRDAVTLPNPEQVSLGGLLGERLVKSETARLLAMDEATLLSGFQKKPGSHPWIGEHVGKWLHAACLSYRSTGSRQLKTKVARFAKALIAAQEPDGYLGTYLPADRFQLKPGADWDVWSHKYCLIGLLAYYDATKDPEALRAARKAADLILKVFGPGGKRLQDAGTHMGMAATSILEPMVGLFRASGDRRYREFAKSIVANYDQEGNSHLVSDILRTGTVSRAANGKAYEMLSNLVGIVELYRATSDESLLKPVRVAWDDISKNRLYITGTASHGEHWTKDGEKPNTGSVGECCVTVTWIQLNRSLYELTGDPKYADQMEASIYNHLLGAQRPDGAGWCYYMPLTGSKDNAPAITCCASSGPRGVALLSSIAYGARNDGVDVLLYGSSTVRASGFVLRQNSSYPLSEKASLLIEKAPSSAKVIRFRIPRWSHTASIRVNGRPVSGVKPGSFAALSRRWKKGDRIDLTFPMPVQVIKGTGSNAGREAVTAGPLVYALQNPSARSAALIGIPRRTGPASLSINCLFPSSDPKSPEHSVLRPFYLTGSKGESYAVWLNTKAPAQNLAEPFRDAMESASRIGNVVGSIADGDGATFTVTYNGTLAKSDWFQVERASPVKISRIVFRHGSVFHDGGWFDASGGKPEIWVKTGAANWRKLGALDAYPATTSTNSAGLVPGQAFEFSFPPDSVSAIRVVGKPASGDSPGQSFSSCAEMQGFLGPNDLLQLQSRF